MKLQLEVEKIPTSIKLQLEVLNSYGWWMLAKYIPFYPHEISTFCGSIHIKCKGNLQETSLIGWQTWRVNVLPQKLAGKYGESIFWVKIFLAFPTAPWESSERSASAPARVGFRRMAEEGGEMTCDPCGCCGLYQVPQEKPWENGDFIIRYLIYIYTMIYSDI